jgi:homoserine dehydrogenase
VKKAQDLGIAETDPSNDVDGWDAAVKVSALATVLMDIPVKPQDVQREGIRALTPEIVGAARIAGQPYKLICQAERNEDGQVTASVRPRPRCHYNGLRAAGRFHCDCPIGKQRRLALVGEAFS